MKGILQEVKLPTLPVKGFIQVGGLPALSMNDFLKYLKFCTRLYELILNNTPTVPQFGVIQESGDEDGDFLFIKKD